MSTRTFAIALAAVLAAPAAHAQDRVRIILNGAYTPSLAGFSETRTFTQFVETATVTGDYEAGSAFVPDLGVQVQFWKKLGAYVAFTTADRDETGTFDASLPHPLYLSRPRSLSGDLTGYGLKENAFHVDLAYGQGQGKIDYAVFAGASFFSVEADVIDSVNYDQSYPYDTVTLRSVPPHAVKESPVGFNVGGRLDYRFGQSRRFGVGTLVRFSRAKAELATTDTSKVEVDAGGFEAGLGVRIYF
jgi:hypothetical protein